MLVKKQFALKTCEDWKKIPYEEKSDLLEGEIYLQAATVKEHGSVQSGISGSLFSLRRKRNEDGSFPKGSWMIGTEMGVVYDEYNAFTHDLAGWKSERLNFIPNLDSQKYLTLPPDWVCEIVSTNWKMDTIMKRKILEIFHVPYYWIVNPKDRSISVLKLNNLNYYDVWGDIKISKELSSFTIPPFENLHFDFNKIFFF